MTKHCPLIQKECVEHQCKWFTHLIGNHPQIPGETIDQFDCAISFLPILLIENANENRKTAASVQSFRNEMVKGNNMLLGVLTNQPLIEEHKNNGNS